MAKQRKTFQMALGAEVEHMHPLGGKAEDDEIYRLGASFSKQDEALFKARSQKFMVK